MTKDLLTLLAEAVLDAPYALLTRELRADIEKALMEHQEQLVNKTVSKKFVPPTEMEVVSHFTHLGVVDAPKHAKQFCLFYGSKDWMIGKNKMKSWMMAASRWAMDLPKGTAKGVIV